ncbi:2-hydroxyglutarate dehydrogenase [Marchantia polymorpha subsp. ruderalis]|uniref:L-2-hydroxyglutarate dehydrogenase, mitochondrial n=2 Tax=Marchantia polymorpha TaxID=3197 RepID=A0AAF6B8S6_MARPO|nr:hypothetical protein MARPO_0011s0121 [Marchantia polymorpha]BBN08410.1 hypothetical protein Mp_4g11370 [Marchantia polymorpha subsp. ruderalis]|eukprot:PTQ46444.1 hypothetical protein MARPO_0011s0121 [Marchantia polymorpha]
MGLGRPRSRATGASIFRRASSREASGPLAAASLVSQLGAVRSLAGRGGAHPELLLVGMIVSSCGVVARSLGAAGAGAGNVFCRHARGLCSLRSCSGATGSVDCATVPRRELLRPQRVHSEAAGAGVARLTIAPELVEQGGTEVIGPRAAAYGRRALGPAPLLSQLPASRPFLGSGAHPAAHPAGDARVVSNCYRYLGSSDKNALYHHGCGFAPFRRCYGTSGSSDSFSASGRPLPREKVDCVVIGAGVVGLAIARELARQGREVIVLEAADAIGTGTSSRNSEVIHAGIYYPRGSLKATLCVAGKHALYTYCKERDIPHKNVGKLIVATGAGQSAVLERILVHGTENGVVDLRMMSGEEAMRMEPSLRCTQALFSPSTGIVDSHAFMTALQTDGEEKGMTLAFNTTVCRGSVVSDEIELVVRESSLPSSQDNEQLLLSAKVVVNAAGLYAQSVARQMQGVPSNTIPQGYYAKGCYFHLSGYSKPPFSHLIYPVPEEGGIGVHVTMDLGGQTRFGPDVDWLPHLDDNELYHPARFDYQVDPRRGDRFYSEVRKYFPALPDESLQPGYSGIRPKLSGKGQPPTDFVIQVQRNILLCINSVRLSYRVEI